MPATCGSRRSRSPWVWRCSGSGCDSCGASPTSARPRAVATFHRLADRPLRNVAAARSGHHRPPARIGAVHRHEPDDLARGRCHRSRASCDPRRSATELRAPFFLGIIVLPIEKHVVFAGVIIRGSDRSWWITPAAVGAGAADHRGHVREARRRRRVDHRTVARPEVTSNLWISRRAVLLGGLGVVAAWRRRRGGSRGRDHPRRTTLHAVLGLNGEEGRSSTRSRTEAGRQLCRRRATAPPVPDRVLPARRAAIGDALPVVIVLHGYNGDHTTTFTQLGLDRFQAEAKSPFAIASVDGGDGYWHARREGGDSGEMVIDGSARARGTGAEDRPGRVPRLVDGRLRRPPSARVSGPDRVAAIGQAESPAMWVDGGHSEGAFDAADYAGCMTLPAGRVVLAGIPVRIDCGTGDGSTWWCGTTSPGSRHRPTVASSRAGTTMPTGGGWHRRLAFLARYLSQG